MRGELGLQGRHGLTWTPVVIVGITHTRYRIRAIRKTQLAGRGRWLKAGETALVPRHAVRFPKATEEQAP